MTDWFRLFNRERGKLLRTQRDQRMALVERLARSMAKSARLTVKLGRHDDECARYVAMLRDAELVLQSLVFWEQHQDPFDRDGGISTDRLPSALDGVDALNGLCMLRRLGLAQAAKGTGLWRLVDPPSGADS